MKKYIETEKLIRTIKEEWDMQELYLPVHFIDIMEEQEVAFDIEKIVEQLENLEPFHVSGYGDTMVNLNDVIEIVKQEDIETNDVCEWIKYDYRTVCPKKHDVGNPYWRIPDNMDRLKYCPFCSKKIKVVES